MYICVAKKLSYIYLCIVFIFLCTNRMKTASGERCSTHKHDRQLYPQISDFFTWSLGRREPARQDDGRLPQAHQVPHQQGEVGSGR